MRQRPKVGEILIEAGVIDEMQLRAALGDQLNWGGRLGVTLVKMGLVEESDLVRALAQQLQIPVVTLEGKRVQQEVLDLVPGEFAEKHSCVPLFLRDENDIKTLFIGMDDPGNLAAIDELSFRTGLSVQPVLVSPSELCEAVDRFYHRGNAIPEPIDVGEPVSARAMDGEVSYGVPTQNLQESLFREVAVPAESLEALPELPSERGAAVPTESPATTASDAPAEGPTKTGADPSQTILRALCQLLTEKQIISAEELGRRVRELETE